LELKWEITPKTNTARAITSETEITTRLDDRSIRCQAKMKVGSSGGRLDQLEILVPLGSEIRGAEHYRGKQDSAHYQGRQKVFQQPKNHL